MPVNPNASIEITAYQWVPSFAEGRIKDLRVRWALEEIGRPYRERLIGGIFEEKPAEYLADQPFGQVPVYKEDGLTLFESGAILLHIGEQDERLLPRDAVRRGRAISWLVAALNSVEPTLQTLVVLSVAGAEQNWREPAMDAARPFAEKRLAQVAHALSDRDWLDDVFSIGDLMMIDVLRAAPTAMLAAHPKLTAYVERGTQRPAFGRALAAQLAAYANHSKGD
ncbi:MAG: glutathione S-transferase N-terminal domain-containing protein [Alphaproteobacteria bacterium]|nr:glutathione S-transferase N-terminal domain-containing protein [Alphaproteobacteria bacterium]MBU0863294.1 glutathione S-transferase N-terminal domain-containing protein [Alphaproteobacteria bacterium]MBU1824301.1 glutathione S-transferase N-terminal domain-containing protein [Alphaproteobacteria bacterium]